MQQPYDPVICTAGYLSQRNKYLSVHIKTVHKCLISALFLIAKAWKTQMSFDRWIAIIGTAISWNSTQQQQKSKY